MSSTICIPARLNSKRLPNKLLLKIKGKSLLQYTYENIKNKGFNHIFILVDDEKLQGEAERIGAQFLSTPKTCKNGTERICWALNAYPEKFQNDLIINVQGDEPLLDVDAVKKMVEQHSSNLEENIYTLCTSIGFNEAKNPSNVKVVIDRKNRALYFSRQLIPYAKEPSKVEYLHHIGVYSYKKDFLKTLQQLDSTPYQQLEDLEQLKILEKGYTIHVERSTKPSIGIDTEHDLRRFKDILLCKQKFYSSPVVSSPL